MPYELTRNSDVLFHPENVPHNINLNLKTYIRSPGVCLQKTYTTPKIATKYFLGANVLYAGTHIRNYVVDVYIWIPP